MPTTFFADLPPFTAFRGVADAERYRAVPATWWVVVTDIVESTAAIAGGRYRDVNTVGAMGIAALQAALPDLMFPFAFGGDGAFALLPDSARAKAEAVLAELPGLVAANFSLELRVGLLSVAELQAEGHAIAVAKFGLRHGYPLAVFRGSGVQRAEERLKAGTARPPAGSADATLDLSGLMCLWRPIRSSRGEVLSLLIDPEPGEGGSVLDAVLGELDAIVGGGLEAADPINIRAMEFQSLPVLLRRERRYQGRLGPYVRRALVAVVMWLLCGTRLHRRLPRLETYLAEFHADSDYRKLGPMLSLVLDCSTQEIEAIEALLDGLHAAGRVDYGLHRSEHCLMTCFVPSPEQGEHMAFVDGGDGGYAMAAKALKSRAVARRLRARGGSVTPT